MASLQRITVETSASIANLGAGYDCLALAVDLMNSYSLYFEDVPREGADSMRSPEIFLQGSFAKDDEVRIGGDGNLFWAAFDEASKHFFEVENQVYPKRRFYIEQTIEIPPKRGLGSSSSAAIAGVLAAVEFFWFHNPRRKLLGVKKSSFRRWQVDHFFEYIATIARDIDNCPDNICASLMGGLTASMVVPRSRSSERQFQGHIRFLRQELRADLGLVALIPTNEISTTNARQVLEPMVTRSAAVSNIQRSTLALRCFEEGRYDLFSEIMWDELHQDKRVRELYREADGKKSLDFEGLVEDLMSSDIVYSVCIGGAGSTLVAFCDIVSVQSVAQRFRSAFERRARPGWSVASCRALPLRNAPPNLEGLTLSANDLQAQPALHEWYMKLVSHKEGRKQRGYMFE